MIINNLFCMQIQRRLLTKKLQSIKNKCRMAVVIIAHSVVRVKPLALNLVDMVEVPLVAATKDEEPLFPRQMGVYNMLSFGIRGTKRQIEGATSTGSSQQPAARRLLEIL
jgi:ABC-type microcin C transport system duplicated ATPase subunit YejF